VEGIYGKEKTGTGQFFFTGSLTFCDFIECVYFVACHYCPDPCMNHLQKFSHFLEVYVVPRMKYKLKNKKATAESPQKRFTLKALGSRVLWKKSESSSSEFRLRIE